MADCIQMSVDPHSAVTVEESGPFNVCLRWGAYRENSLILTNSQATAVVGGIRRVTSDGPRLLSEHTEREAA